jgi:hypothetical protein
MDAPRLITNVETTPATTPDDNMVEVVHRSLKSRNPQVRALEPFALVTHQWNF